MSRVLIIDDDRMLSKAMARLTEDMGHEAVCALTLTQGLEKASSGAYDVVFLDVLMPDGNGLEVLPRIRESSSSPEIIIITASGDPDGAELAIKSGAWGYVEKSSSIKEMMLHLDRALQYRQGKLSRTPPTALKRDRIVGSSPEIEACFDLLAQASISDAPVLITGETGTGKELFAQAIHENSLRADREFVVVDCTALPETLVESLLFGHERGAFTGADRAKEGLVQQAHGGTLFLDEVGELPASTQKSFLRVLQEHRFRRLGGRTEIEVEFRLITATNRDLSRMVEQGRFREDLLFRLRSLTIEIPPLRNRPEDIKDLARFHLARLCDSCRMETKGLSQEFLDALVSYEWPGNVRELVHTLDAAIASARDDLMLFSQHLPTHLRVQMVRASIRGERPEGIPHLSKTLPKLRDFRRSVEGKYLQDLMARTGRDIKRACQISGLSRSHLYELLSKHDLLSSNP